MSKRQIAQFNTGFCHDYIGGRPYVCEAFINGIDPLEARDEVALVKIRGLGSACTNAIAAVSSAPYHGMTQHDAARASRFMNTFLGEHETDMPGGLSVEFDPRLPRLAPALAELVMPEDALMELRIASDVREVHAVLTGQMGMPELPAHMVEQAVALDRPDA